MLLIQGLGRFWKACKSEAEPGCSGQRDSLVGRTDMGQIEDELRALGVGVRSQLCSVYGRVCFLNCNEKMNMKEE